MALIKCPDCGQEISDKAFSCIHCGYSLSTATTSKTAAQQKEKSCKGNRLSGIISALITLAGLVLSIYGRNFQSQDVISIVQSLSGGALLYFSMIPCLAAITLYLSSAKRAIKISCIITTFYSIIVVIFQLLLLSRFQFAGALCTLTIIIASLHTIACWLSAYAAFKSITPLVISLVCYTAGIFAEVFFAARYGMSFSTAFFLTALPTVLYYVGNAYYIRSGISRAHFLRMGEPNSAEALPNMTAQGIHDAPSIGYGVLSFCFPIVGLVLYCVWREGLPQRAKSAGIGGLTGFIIGAALLLVRYVILLT